jgi:hypothetical protein
MRDHPLFYSYVFLFHTGTVRETKRAPLSLLGQRRLCLLRSYPDPLPARHCAWGYFHVLLMSHLCQGLFTTLVLELWSKPDGDSAGKSRRSLDRCKPAPHTYRRKHERSSSYAVLAKTDEEEIRKNERLQRVQVTEAHVTCQEKEGLE